MLKCAAKLSPFLLLGKSPSRFVGLAEPLQGQKPGWRVHRASWPKAAFPGGEAGVREESRASPPHGSIPGPVSQCGASVIAARCVGPCSALRLTGGQAVVPVFVASPGMSGTFVRSPWAAASAALPLLSSPAGLEKRVRQYTPVCVLAHSWYVVNPCGGQGRKAGQGCPGAEAAGRESPCGCLTACRAGLRSCHIRR